MITVSEIMSTEVISLGPDESISKAAEIMAENNIRHIPVVDQKSQVIGIVSQRDVLKSGALYQPINQGEVKVDRQTISMIMSEGTLSTHPKDSLRAAGLTLQKHKYGCLPVIENNALVGIITDTDFVGVAINLIEEKDSLEDADDSE